ncbi:MAG: 2Fe-2S iron-sulfur cluster binding domain-containing protein [Bdellovibrionales bacterium]|nr:2Fe-2S iron-sulfur cluster binding domain-containing protein [Bdellovibrionales bacterium]
MSDVKVVFTINGQEHETTMTEYQSVLEAALRLQINPPYSCLEGICGTCSAFLEQGEVDSIEGRVNEQSKDRTFKTCMAQPKSKFLRVNYDKANT